MSEPTKSGDKPITEEQITDDETTKALEEQAATEAEIAESHLLPESSEDPALTREEYDRVGKGENYQPKDWQTARPDDRTFTGADVTAVDRSGQARLQKARGSGQDREPQGTKPKQVEAPKS